MLQYFFPYSVDRQIIQRWKLATSRLVRTQCQTVKNLTVMLNSTGLPISLVLFMADSPITLPLNSVVMLGLRLKEKQTFFRLIFLHTHLIFIQLLLKLDLRQKSKKCLYAMLKCNMSHSDITLKCGKAEVKIQ